MKTTTTTSNTAVSFRTAIVAVAAMSQDTSLPGTAANDQCQAKASETSPYADEVSYWMMVVAASVLQLILLDLLVMA